MTHANASLSPYQSLKLLRATLASSQKISLPYLLLKFSSNTLPTTQSIPCHPVHYSNSFSLRLIYRLFPFTLTATQNRPCHPSSYGNSFLSPYNPNIFFPATRPVTQTHPCYPASHQNSSSITLPATQLFPVTSHPSKFFRYSASLQLF